LEAFASLAPQIAVALVIVGCAAWLSKEMRRRVGGGDDQKDPASKSDVARLEGHIEGRLSGYQAQLDCLTEEQAETRVEVERHSGKLDAILQILRKNGGPHA